MKKILIAALAVFAGTLALQAREVTGSVKCGKEKLAGVVVDVHDGDVGLDLGMGHNGGAILVLHHDIRVPQAGLYITVLCEGFTDDVLGVLVDLHGAVGQDVLVLQQDGQLLVLHVDQADGLLGDLLGIRSNSRHRVAHIADLFLKNQRIQRRIKGQGVTAGGEGNVRHVVIGQDGPDTGQRLRLGRVDAFDNRMRVRTPQDLALQEMVELHVAHIGRLTGDFVIGVNSLDWLSNNEMLVQSISLLSLTDTALWQHRMVLAGREPRLPPKPIHLYYMI